MSRMTFITPWNTALSFPLKAELPSSDPFFRAIPTITVLLDDDALPNRGLCDQDEHSIQWLTDPHIFARSLWRTAALHYTGDRDGEVYTMSSPAVMAGEFKPYSPRPKHDRLSFGSQWKGKAKEDRPWQIEWWDLCSLAEGKPPPLAWSRSSTIFTAHASEPKIVARLFPSSKPCTIPSPPQILSTPASYEPPTIISVALNDEWLFAYFPGKDCDGISCLWKKMPQADEWQIKDCWTCARGAGVIAASWIGQEREVSLTKADPNTYNGMDLNLSLDMPRTRSLFADASLALEWETWGETPTIELCEVDLDCDGLQMCLSTTPLPSISHPHHLCNMVFVPTPPTSTAYDPTASPALSVRSGGSVKKESDSGSVHGGDPRKPASLLLAAIVLDFGDYTSTPKSKLIVHAFRRNSMTTPIRPAWSSQLQASRSLASGIATFISPPPPGLYTAGLLVGVMDTAGIVSKSKARPRQATFGTVELLKLYVYVVDSGSDCPLIATSRSDLSNNEMWDRCPLLCGSNQLGRICTYLPIQSHPCARTHEHEVPQRAVISPNHSLICTVPAAFEADTHPAVHPFPSPTQSDGGTPESTIYMRRATSDITYLLSLPSTTLQDVEDTLYATLSSFTKLDDGLWEMWLEDVLGVAMECYRARSRSTEGESVKEDLALRWRTAHDALSVVACLSAFKDCRDGDSWDLSEASSLLEQFLGWTIQFLEKLIKECILCDTTPPAQVKPEAHDDLFGSNPPSPAGEREHPFSYSVSPTLLHLAHPYLLGNLTDLVGHLNSFRNYVQPLPAGGEHAHLAKAVFLDLFDASAVDVPKLHGILDSLKTSQTVDPEASLRSLASCKPHFSMNGVVHQAVQKLLGANVADKPRLFIKPSSLVDGLTKLCMEDQDRKEKARDVLTKGVLVNAGASLRCVRCGGLSEVARQFRGSGNSSERWRAWERRWTLNCICGGLWSNANHH
ncbi:hypothetical protein GLOTRDRAFT_91770 [Gloeophyllum trabeum ATCC 11539]|uniref:Mediator complex subunit 16 C-terminal domain-containing protein n=1 Tax=Gloeophyllum trabeum (strain ATCC 11539 / FP-39264 / Madison 617) TaxID=670483 RepID=S7QGL1_GLOTA|nr:uncharacterized protein GLOTRDRAFT_91770 [Gloeophyllum trabeum ATCC 11539]EPQ58333.1 hypothetical protein GLOTRDRAFT_91770 [Gloeophyllum trabeum ATCC 11539]